MNDQQLEQQINEALELYEEWSRDNPSDDMATFARVHDLHEEVVQGLREHLELESDLFLNLARSSASSFAPPRNHFEPGDWIEKYQLVQLLGQGGMGAVWLARQFEPVQRQVALKLVCGTYDQTSLVARFDRERQILAKLNHPCIAMLLDAGATAAGTPYFVMEYVPGMPLTEYCAAEQLPLETRLHLFLELAAAIQYAHSLGILHRDLKPANILVTQVAGRPFVKVIDFGLAKLFNESQPASAHLTLAGTTLGSPLWMSPEQISLVQTASEQRVDHRADIYSLGVILFQLLTGTTPIREHDVQHLEAYQLLAHVLQSEPRPPSERIRELLEEQSSMLPPEIDASFLEHHNARSLDRIVLRATAKAPDERQQDITELIQDIKQLSLFQQNASWRHPRRRPAGSLTSHKWRTPIAVAVGLIVCGFLAILVAVAWLKYRDREKPAELSSSSSTPTRSVEARTTESEELAGAINPDAQAGDQERSEDVVQRRRSGLVEQTVLNRLDELSQRYPDCWQLADVVELVNKKGRVITYTELRDEINQARLQNGITKYPIRRLGDDLRHLDLWDETPYAKQQSEMPGGIF